MSARRSRRSGRGYRRRPSDDRPVTMLHRRRWRVLVLLAMIVLVLALLASLLVTTPDMTPLPDLGPLPDPA
ncbi:hypothetical protein C8E95_6197 [Pseudonocardia autotrophica]|uniref:Uncharacterized protein n=2 Tax=Pseudonocardia TaxID=1847 RepID=A0A1Y2MI21_PSEAH|nr:hypothetical protein BG845_06427 [Pseudonocardia autotrophica]TDN76976.1 hypothetical protein C8E95_6197 [Pseudonocardia autotrophica]